MTFVVLTLPSEPMMISTLTVPTNLICFATSGYRGVGLEIAFRASWPDMLAAAAHTRMAAQRHCFSLIPCPLKTHPSVVTVRMARRSRTANGTKVLKTALGVELVINRLKNLTHSAKVEGLPTS